MRRLSAAPLIALLLALATAPCLADPAPLGRLFFTAEQRARLDLQRQRNPGFLPNADDEASITINGEVRSSNGRRTRWINGEPQPAAARSPGADHGQPGTLVEFECGNPDYLISRVLSASGSLRVLAPVTLRQRVTETARAISRRNVSPGQSEVSVPRTATRS